MRFVIKVLTDFINSIYFINELFNHNFSIAKRLKIDNNKSEYFETGKFEQKIKITVIDISCKNLLPKERCAIYILHQFS